MGGIWVYIHPKSVQVDFLWGKNDITTAIDMSIKFYTRGLHAPYPQNKFLATPLLDLGVIHFHRGRHYKIFGWAKSLPPSLLPPLPIISPFPPIPIAFPSPPLRSRLLKYS